jgi:hypothetical protein
MKRPTIAAAIFATIAAPIGLATPVSAAAPLDVAVVNRGVVELQTGRAAGISVRIAEDLANLIDDGATRRVLPVIGKGSLQNITDLKLLRGIDMAILLRPEVTAAYVPTRLTAQDYPGLVPGDQPVDTVAVGAVLAAANLQFGSDRYRNLVNFVEAFFTGFQTLLEPGHHPKWREVNITAELPGWRRFPPAEEWLQRNIQAAAPPNLQDLKTIFARFIDERQQAAGGQPMSQQEKDQLFGQFELWQKSQTR